MTLSGNKVKKYLIITCPNCLESYRIDYRILINKFSQDLMYFIPCECPWCERTTEVEIFSIQNEYMYVNED